jgi:hypothetical protein
VCSDTPASPNAARDQHRPRLAVGPECLAVEQHLGVELARAPALQDGAQLIVGDVEQVRDRRHVRRERDDRADVEIAIRPAVETMPDARRERVVDRRVTQRARDADVAHRAVGVRDRFDADHRVRGEQRLGDRGIVEVDLAGLQRRDDIAWQGVDIDLDAERERGGRADTEQGAVELERVAPEIFVSESIVAERLPTLRDHP